MHHMMSCSALGSVSARGPKLSTYSSLLLLSSRSSNWICRSCQLSQTRTGLGRKPHSLVFNKHNPLSTRAHVATRPYAPIYVRTFAEAKRDKQNDDNTSQSPAIQHKATEPSDKIQQFSDKLQRVVNVARLSWNDLVGYTEIEKSRARVAEQEQLIQTRKLDLHFARDAYRAAVEKHAGSLRETRDLLARKDDWSEQDAVKFASLHTSTRTDENAEQTSRRTLQVAEMALENETERLSSKIGTVYQAESMYNAKILQVKTWWTWALMALNATVFLFNVYLIQMGLNPRYRKDMDLSDEAFAKIRAAILEAKGSTEAKSASPATLVTINSNQPDAKQGEILLSNDPISNPDPPGDIHIYSTRDLPPIATIAERMKGLFSSTLVTWQMSEITTLAIQGAVVGAAATTLVAIALQK